MTTRKRHHYVPRFLLARFASRRRDEKSWVWQISSEKAIEVSTKDAAVSKHFYGQDTSIEDALVPLETSYGAALRRLDSGEPPDNDRETLRGLLWTLVIRGKSVREQFARLGVQMVDSTIASLDSEAGRRGLRVGMDSFDEQLDEMLASVPPPLRAFFDSPAMRANMKALAGEMIDNGELSKLVRGVMNGSNLDQAARDAARRGQLKGLARILDDGVTPKTFDPAAWEVVRFSRADLILGDVCVIGADDAGETGSMLRMSDRWTAAYLPISPTTCLVAWRNRRGTPLQQEELARASWELADDYVYGPQDAPGVQQSAAPGSFGSRSDAMSDEEIEALLVERWEEAARR